VATVPPDVDVVELVAALVVAPPLEPALEVVVVEAPPLLELEEPPDWVALLPPLLSLLLVALLPPCTLDVALATWPPAAAS
jgi:hypothetical protein